MTLRRHAVIRQPCTSRICIGCSYEWWQAAPVWHRAAIITFGNFSVFSSLVLKLAVSTAVLQGPGLRRLPRQELNVGAVTVCWLRCAARCPQPDCRHEMDVAALSNCWPPRSGSPYLTW